MIFVSFALTGILIYKLISESQKNPVVIYTDQNVISVQDINFPAVSLCFGLPYKLPCHTVLDYDHIKLDLESDSAKIKNLTLDNLKMLQLLSLVARDGFVAEKFPDLKIPTDDLVEIIENFDGALPYKHKYNPGYLGNWINDYFVDTVKTLSDSGFCYTFNRADADFVYQKNS